MSAAELLGTAWETARETASYLLAYSGALLLAPAVHLAFVALGVRHRGAITASRGGAVRRAAAAIVLGLTSPLSGRAVEADLRALGAPGALCVYLAALHALNAYALVLLGPLLGKDFLLWYAVGVALFALFAALLARSFGVPAAPPPRGGGEPARFPALVGTTALRSVGLITLGLAVGGLVAAWGFSPGARAPAQLAAPGLATQLVNAALGLALAPLGISPIANLFVGTYLWKVGLAHAGIVAFFCAAPAAPTRWLLYRRLFGARGAARLLGALALAALLAGLATAALAGATGASIRYKLVPEQLWRTG